MRGLIGVLEERRAAEVPVLLVLVDRALERDEEDEEAVRADGIGGIQTTAAGGGRIVSRRPKSGARASRTAFFMVAGLSVMRAKFCSSRLHVKRTITSNCTKIG